MAKHKLVVIGDSLSQGFMSGAIHRTDISYPVLVAEAMGVRDSFVVPDFTGEGGLPLNLERLLGDLSKRFGPTINWWEIVPVVLRLHGIMDATEDFWERGKGSKPYNQVAICHNLAVWGFEVRDAYTVTEGICQRAIPQPKDDLLKQVPEMAMYRTARRVFNPTFEGEKKEWSHVRLAKALARDGGVENLVVGLGANNALGTVTSLKVDYSQEADLYRLPHQRQCNLYLPEHFEQLYTKLANEVEAIGAERVFAATVPHVTIPPVTRGVPSNSFNAGYYDYYTRPWVWDSVFEPDKHQHLTREDAQRIDSFIDEYNKTIRSVAKKKRRWHVFDMCGMLDKLAFRRSAGQPKYKFPQGLVKALKNSQNLKYLVGANNNVQLDTRFFMCDPDNPGRIKKGGIFSLDGIHPTTIGYSLVADLLVKTMKKANVSFPGGGKLPWDAIVTMDTLVNDPPAMLAELRDCLAFLDKRGLLSAVIEQFA